MILGKFSQQPRERIPYSISYEEALSIGDEVEAATGSISPADGVLSAVFFTGGKARFYVSGLTDGITYSVSIIASTRGGSIFEDEVHIKAKEYT